MYKETASAPHTPVSQHCPALSPAPPTAAHLALDVGIVAALAIGAYTLDNPLVWPIYWFLQGTMFWALFVVGHDWWAPLLLLPPPGRTAPSPPGACTPP